MSALRGSAPRGARSAWADTTGCEACRYCKPGMLFTLCRHPDSEYIREGKTELHTIQHMRDVYVGECGQEMRLREIKE